MVSYGRTPNDGTTSAPTNGAIAPTALAQKETRTVARLRDAMFVLLLATALAVSLKVYFFTRNDQTSDFEVAFRFDATKVLELFHRNLERRLELVEALSVTITSHELNTKETFPNVSWPDCVVRFAHCRVLTGSVFVNYLPLVTDANRQGWEAYQIANGLGTTKRSFWKSRCVASQMLDSNNPRPPTGDSGCSKDQLLYGPISPIRLFGCTGWIVGGSSPRFWTLPSTVAEQSSRTHQDIVEH
jgi:hypothetical protein